MTQETNASVSPEENPNTNCLAGMKCPKCGNHASFSIHATQSGPVRVTDDGTDFIEGNVEWEGYSECICRECGHEATVGEFKGQPAPAFDELQQTVLEAYNGGDFALLKPGEQKSCGDTLLSFLLTELSHAEDCEDGETAVRRLDTAIKELQEVQAAFERKL